MIGGFVDLLVFSNIWMFSRGKIRKIKAREERPGNGIRAHDVVGLFLNVPCRSKSINAKSTAERFCERK